MSASRCPSANGNNRIRVVARSKTDLLGEASLEITQNGEGALDKRDTPLHHRHWRRQVPEDAAGLRAEARIATCDLSYAGADAKAFAETIEKQMGRQHSRSSSACCSTAPAARWSQRASNIENAFDMLLEAKDNDTVAVFIAGHGYNDPRSGYQFLPTNVRAGDSGNWASSSIIKWTDPGNGDPGRQGSPPAVRRHLPLGQRLQRPPDQGRERRRHRRLLRHQHAAGRARAAEPRPRRLHVRAGQGPQGRRPTSPRSARCACSTSAPSSSARCAR